MKPATLFDGEWKLMELLWEKGSLTAKEASRLAAERIGWSKNTTYTVLTKLVEKGFVRRSEPDFTCTPAVARDEARARETAHLIDRLFEGSRQAFLSSFLEKEDLTPEEAEAIRRRLDGR